MKLKLILNSLLLLAAAGAGGAEPPNPNNGPTKGPDGTPGSRSEQLEKKAPPSDHKGKASDARPGSKLANPPEPEGIQYHPANRNTVTSCVGISPKDYLRYASEGGSSAIVGAKEGAELVFSWKEEKEQKGEVVLQLYSVRRGQSPNEINTSKTKPIYSVNAEKNNIKLSSFSKALPKGSYVWRIVRKQDGKIVSASNPEVLEIHAPDIIDGLVKKPKHKRKPSKEGIRTSREKF